MKRFDPIKNLISVKQPHFIGAWNMENNNLCSEIIAHYKKNEIFQTQGITTSGKNLKYKKRTDLTIEPKDLDNLEFKCFKNYFSELHKCFIDYQSQWPFLKDMIKNIDIGSFHVGKYLPGDHFAVSHTERCSLSTLHRVFAWMTYLNDVEDGGETNFQNYGIKIKPEIGKTLIWPAEWTHAHSGEVLNSGVKYVITGWMFFPFEENKKKLNTN